jgi:DNA-binding CsgD family transcriptional regulator/tetratricopeptide (TPR) repeat protein
MRLSEEHETAADLARRVRMLAAERGDPAGELAACLELAQDLLKATLGESFSPSGSEIDVDGGEEALQRAVQLAEELGDDWALAAALRELGTVVVSRIRDWFVARYLDGQMFEFMQRVTRGESVLDIVPTLPIAPDVAKADQFFQRALGIFERLGDRRGVMSTVIAMAFIAYGPVIHLSSSARHIEEIRRLMLKMTTMTSESERARHELQMLYGVHVYARAKVVPDLTLSRGEEAYRAARALGDRSVEFLAAGGVALAHAEMGEVEEAEAWLDKAAGAAAMAPTPLRARQLEMWRGMVRGVAGDAAGMREHLEQAVKMATDQGRPAARCEALARLALESARLGAETGDQELLRAAERAASEAKDVLALLPGHPPWGAQADAALAATLLAQGDLERALAAAGEATQALIDAHHEDANLDVTLPTSRVILGGAPEAMQTVTRDWLQLTLSGIVQRTLDEDVRVRWLRGPVGRELVRLAGPIDGIGAGAGGNGRGSAIGDDDHRLLNLLTEGYTNGEIADELGLTEEAVGRRLGKIFARIGASTRAEATSFAFRENIA